MSESTGVDTLQQAVKECQICIDNFLKTIQGYQSLTAGKSTPKDQVLKVKWALGHKDDVQKFRETLSKRTAALTLLLGTIQLRSSLAFEENAGKRSREHTKLLAELQASVSANDAEHLGLLRKIEGLLLTQSQAKSHDQLLGPEPSTLPFKLHGAPLAPAFVQRAEFMHAIEEELLPVSETQQTVLILQGMGGMGKSQIAREYSCKHKDKYTAVFWINAKSENTLKNGMATIAARLKRVDVLNMDGSVGNDKGDVAKAIAAVLEWFNEDGNTKWLLILDNVDSQVQSDRLDDDDEQPSHTEGFDALQYIPSNAQGTMLFTSRLSYLARAMGGVSIAVDQMTPGEGLELLCGLSKRKSNEPGAEELVQSLGCYPLALSQCGRYISETQDSFLKYLSRYEVKLKALLKQDPSPREYQNGSIAVTLGLSYDALKARNSTAAALLAFCGCLDNTDIFWKLFDFGFTILQADIFPEVQIPTLPWISGLDPNWFRSIRSDEEQYDEAVRSLLVFSFVRQGSETSGISIHPIVHQWSLSLYKRDTRNAFLEKSADMIGQYFIRGPSPNPAASEEALFNRFRPHADRCYDLISTDLNCLNWTAATLISFGSYFSHQCQFDQAKSLVEAGLPILEREQKWDTAHKVLVLRWMISIMYDSWDQDDVSKYINLCAGRELARTFNKSQLKTRISPFMS